MNSIEKEKADRLRMYNERLKNGQPLTEICPDISNCFQKYSQNYDPNFNKMDREMKNTLENISFQNQMYIHTPQNSRIDANLSQNYHQNATINSNTGSNYTKITKNDQKENQVDDAQPFCKTISQIGSYVDLNYKQQQLNLIDSKKSLMSQRDSHKDSLMRDYTQSQLNMMPLNVEPESVLNTYSESDIVMLNPGNSREVLRNDLSQNKLKRKIEHRQKYQQGSYSDLIENKNYSLGNNQVGGRKNNALIRYENKNERMDYINIANYSNSNIVQGFNPSTIPSNDHSRKMSNTTIYTNLSSLKSEASRLEGYQIQPEAAI